MRHLSPLELRTLRAVQDRPRHGTEPLAKVVGEATVVVRSTLRTLRQFGLVDQERIALIGYPTYQITWAGDQILGDWGRWEMRDGLPPGVLPLHPRRYRDRRAARA